MPIVSVNRDLLFKELEQTYTKDEFDELCFEFGIELDDVIEEADGQVTYKIDLPANRYDLLCLEGLVTALKVFSGKQNAPQFVVKQPEPAAAAATKMTVKAETAQIRPFVVCAILRNVQFDEDRFNSFIDLQTHLHRNICRRRTLVAIGTHDLDTIQGPFTYEALKPEEINFRHLNAATEMNGRETLDWFRGEENLNREMVEYTNIIYDSPVYPVLYDANRTVLSLPPVINGFHSKMTADTKNVFIECTATDRTKAAIVLNTICAMFSGYCAEPYTIEAVQVEYEKEPHPNYGVNKVFPDMSQRTASADIDEICSTIGVEIPPAKVCELLSKMMLGPAVFDQSKRSVTVTVPVTRSDILHACDIIEDVAIAYGYNNVPKTMPVSHTPGKEYPINLLSDLIRDELARAGYQEILSLGLHSRAENSTYLRLEHDPLAVSVGNPKTIGFEIARTTLKPGLLRTLGANKYMAMGKGVQLFEVSDVVLKDDSEDVGCRNERHLAALYTGNTAGMEVIHGLIDRIMQTLCVVPSAEYCADAAESTTAKSMVESGQSVGAYKIVAGDSPTFMVGRCAKVVCKLNAQTDFVEVGEFGILHPEVLQKYGHTFPASVCELNLEFFL